MTAHEWKQTGKQAVLVFSDNGRSMGLAVDEVVDIVRDRMAIELSSNAGPSGQRHHRRQGDRYRGCRSFPHPGFYQLVRGNQGASQGAPSLRALSSSMTAPSSATFWRRLRAAQLAGDHRLDGVEALSSMEREGPFDIMISDIEMPKWMAWRWPPPCAATTAGEVPLDRAVVAMPSSADGRARPRGRL